MTYIKQAIGYGLLALLALLSSSNLFAAASEKQTERVFRYKNAQGGIVFSDQIPKARDYQVLVFDCYACNPDSNINWHKTPLFIEQYQREISAAAIRHQLDPALIRAVIHAESAFNPQARSKTGAAGLMQLMPNTAEALGVYDRYNPAQNIEAGSRYLAQMLKRFNGDISLSCAAYNAGPTLVSQLGRIPNYPETQTYVKRVQILLQRYQAANLAI